MADPEHLEIVRGGAATVAQWRKSHPDTRLDLQEADLKRADLRQIRFGSVNLDGAKLEDAKLSRANMDGAFLNRGSTRGGSLRSILGRGVRIPRGFPWGKPLRRKSEGSKSR